jgi:serine phosphatase RsbU (regulator of sigma subunit)
MHGKTLFVYTDGINEAENDAKEQFGDERLKALLQQNLGNARQTSEAIHKAIEEFVGGAEPSDDLTKMCIKMTNTQISRFATVVKTTTREENPTLSIFKEK